MAWLSSTAPPSWPAPLPVIELNRILIIRGGAIGDFVLTLPAIKLLRDRFPNAHLEVVGVPHIIALADQRVYADAVRSLDSASIARFFAANSELPRGLSDYFASFDLILSYLYDPDRIFRTNIEKCSEAIFVAGPAKLDGSEHAAFQLARPLHELGLFLTDPAARLFPNEEDCAAVCSFRRAPFVALHPGSGSETKNWPIENWIQLGNALLTDNHVLLVVSGEADRARTACLKSAWPASRVRFAEMLPLPHLAALLAESRFIGHDSGISHIAAAVNARCLLLFGRTDPAIWAPAGENENVTVIRAPDGEMSSLPVDEVYELMRIGIRT